MFYSKRGRALRIAVVAVILLVVAVVLTIGIFNSLPYGNQPQIEANAHNVILLIGDGMGFEHIRAASYFGDVSMDEFEYSGSVTTRSLSHSVTDSAAAATAMATGKKTFNAMLSYSGTEKLTNLGEIVKENNKKLGVVVTKSVTDATPAAFTAHSVLRTAQAAIALEQIREADCDVLFGEGRQYFDTHSARINREDRAYINSLEALKANTKPKAYAIFDKVEPDSEHNLAVLTGIALDMLTCEQGFFLMVEGSKIDSHSHNNKMDKMLAEFWAFNDAVLVALEYAKSHTNTTVIVTDYHETGGLTLPTELSSTTINNDCFTTTGHTNANVGYFAYGPGASEIPELIDNTDLFYIINQLLFA